MQEVGIEGPGGGAQGVAGLQGVVPVVQVGGVPEEQAALQGVLVGVQLQADHVGLDQVLRPPQPA